MAIATNGLQLVRIAGAVFNQQLSAADYSEILTANKTAAELNAWANSAVAAEFKGKTTTDIAKAVLANLGLTQPGLDAWLAGQLTAGGGVAKAGETMLSLLNDYSNMTADATFGSFATTFNTKAAGSQALSQTAGTATGTFAAVSTANTALTLTAATQTSTGTTGDDTFTAAAGTWGTGDVVNGGTGTDTLNATITGTGPTQSATSLVGVEVLNVTASPNPATLDLTGVAGLTEVNNASSANGATLSVTGLGKVVNTTITGGNTSTSIAYATAAVVGTADAATVSLKGAAAGSSFTTSGVETLTINSGTSANILASLSAVGMSKLVVTGDQALTIGGTTGNSGTSTVVGTTTFDLSAATGALTLSTGTGTGGTGSVVGVTVTGPTAATAGALTLTTNSLNDTVTLGAGTNTVSTLGGIDTITSGGGANTITPGQGNDTINAGAGVDTIRFADTGATHADTINAFGSTDVIAVHLGAAAVTGTSAAAASASTAFGVVPTGATSPVLQNVGGTATANAVVFQAIGPNATATVGTVAAASNVIALNGAYTDGTVAGAISALGTSATTGITTTTAGKFLLVTYSVGNIAQVWSYAGDTTTVDTNIEAAELSLVATLNGVAQNSLTAANFSTYLTPVAATTTVSNAGQTVNLTGTLNTVLSTANAAGQFLTAGADTINVGVGTLPTAVATSTSGLTIIDPGTGDADVMNATVLAGAWSDGIVISGVETINLNMLVAGTTFSAAAKTPGTTQFGLTGSQNFTNTGMPNGGGITLGAGYTGLATTGLVSGSGSADVLVVNLSGSTATSATAGAALTNVGSGVETATVNVTAASSIRISPAADGTLGAAGTGLFGPTLADITAVKLAGSSNLTVFGGAAGMDSITLNGSDVGYTGSLTLRPTTNASMDFSAAGIVTGIKTIDLQDSPTYVGTITYSASNSTTGGLATTISNSPAAVAIQGAITVAVLGGGSQSDSVTFSEGSKIATIGNIIATGIETLTIASARASTDTVFTIGTTTQTDGPGTQKLVVTGASPVATGVLTADTIDFSGVTGAVTITGAPVNTAGIAFTGGNGGVTMTVGGTTAADVFTFGSGADTIRLSDGDDLITLGTGADIISYVFGGATVATAVGATFGPTVTDFTTAIDTLLFDKSDWSLGGTASGLTATNTAIAAADFYNGVSTSLVAGTAYTVVVLSAAGYANVAAAEDAVNTTSTSATGAIVIYLDTTVGYARAFYDADIGANDGNLTDTSVILNFTNITALTGLATLTAADFLMIA